MEVETNFKEGIHRDEGYILWLREQPCMITGMRTNDYHGVDPAHTGVGGRGLKGPDKHALPLAHSLHLKSHNGGVTTFWLNILAENPDILTTLLANYAENVYYKQYLEEKS